MPAAIRSVTRWQDQDDVSFAGVALGDLSYRGASAWNNLPGNTSATRKFFRQVGTGAASAAPAWDTLQAGDIPDLSARYQPLDGDLTALAATTGTNTIYYRSGTSTWTAVTVGTGLLFTAGTLNAISTDRGEWTYATNTTMADPGS